MELQTSFTMKPSRSISQMPKLKKSKKSTKSTRLISIKKLQKRCEEAWKEVIKERDGDCCKVRQHFPLLEIKHQRIYQADHCISRKNKLLFLDSRNGTMVCSACNQAKGFNNKSISRAVDEIVERREGKLAFELMVQMDMRKSVNPNWAKRWWLEEQLKGLINGREEIIRRREVCTHTDGTGQTQFINPSLDIASSGDCGNDCT